MDGMRVQWPSINQTTGTLTKDHNSCMPTDPMEQRIAFLRSLSLFAGLNDDELRFLSGEAQERIFQAEDVIFHQGAPGYTCHIIIQGKVRIYVIAEDGRELSISILGPGEIIGEMALFDDMPRSANVEAIEKTHTLELHQDVLLHGLQRSPTLALSLLRALSARLRNTTEEAEGLASMTVTDRLLLRLERLAQWSGRPAPGGVRITLPMTQQELAALVGTSRESINRALAGLRRRGRVRLEDGWIVLLDER